MIVVKRLNLDPSKIFIGVRFEIPEILEVIDIVVLPSLSESFSIVALEAMRAGKPVVASSVGGIPEVVIDGYSGLIVPPCSHEKIAAAVSELISNPQKQHLLGRQGQSLVQKKFSPSRMIDQYLNVYYDCLGK